MKWRGSAVNADAAAPNVVCSHSRVPQTADPSASFVGIHLCARAGRSDPQQSERRVGTYVSSRRELDRAAGRSSPGQPECQYHGSGEAAGRLRGRHKRSRDRNSRQVVKSISGGFHCSRPPRRGPVAKGTNPTLVTIAEVGHLVLLWRPKPAALPANDVVSAVALPKRGARLWQRPTATSPSIK